MRALSTILGFLLSISAHALDIPVPNEIRDPGAIKLIGTPGKNQKDDYQICAVAREKNGQLKKSGVDNCTAHKINEEVHLPAGTYVLSYSGLKTFAEVQTSIVTISLLPLLVDKIDGTFTYNLYVDVQVTEEQNKILDLMWIGAASQGLALSNYRCDKDSNYTLDATAKGLCALYRSVKSPADLKSTLKFTDHGQVYSKQILQTEKETPDNGYVYTAGFSDSTDVYYYVGSGSDGDTVAVFPGTYAASFKSSGGHVNYQTNIVIK
ncbi:MAG: hypothetical protein ACXVA9_00320 [Bdellovibrionales bacterium]